MVLKSRLWFAPPDPGVCGVQMVLSNMLTMPPPDAKKEMLEAFLKLLAEAYQSTCTLARNLQVLFLFILVYIMHTGSLALASRMLAHLLQNQKAWHAGIQSQSLIPNPDRLFCAMSFMPQQTRPIQHCWDPECNSQQWQQYGVPLAQDLVGTSADVMELVDLAFSEVLEQYPELELQLLRLQYHSSPYMVTFPPKTASLHRSLPLP